MPRRKKAEEPEKENTERWLLTYSDMITLLLALFIMLFAISNVDAQKFKAFSTAFAKAFGTSTVSGTGSAFGVGSGLGTTSGGLGTLSISGESSSSASDSSGAGSGTGDTGKAALDEVYNELVKYVDQNHLESQITIVNSETYVAIRLKDLLMFVPGEKEMLPTSKPIIKNIATAISKVYSRVDHITITGHTAKIGTDDQNAWDLSTQRANVVLFAFMSNGLAQTKFSTEGRGHQQPIATNDTELGRAENRRVEITITKAPTGSSSTSSKASSTTSSTASSATSSKTTSSQGTSQGAASK